jgi:hypothetical protein
MVKLRISRRKLLAMTAGGTVSSLTEACGATGEPPAGFPAPITAIPFGSVSHWLQPWRPLCQTRSIDQIEAGVGIMVGQYAAQQDALDMLRQQGFRLVRTEIPWGLVDPKTETQFVNQSEITSYLARLRRAELRPLVLLNANHGWPCPRIFYDVQVATDTPAGARTMTLVSTSGLVPGRSGIKHLPQFLGLGSVLVSDIQGQEVSLSRPLPSAIPAGTTVPFVTLAYEPFSQPGTARNERTMQGWLRYVDITCKTVRSALGTANEADCGFDLEIWNELSFGSKFLSINNYYEPRLIKYNYESIFSEIVQRTVAQVKASPALYPGMQISDGFANTIPWPASSHEPPGVSAISKHPYPPSISFPFAASSSYPEEDIGRSIALDATGRKTHFVPSYSAYFPEYYANVIQTESLCRDLSDTTNDIGHTRHGRLARSLNGQISPVDVWITELGCEPRDFHITEPAKAERFTTAFALRSLFFHLGIGAARVYLFHAYGAPGALNLVNPATPNKPSQALLAIARILSTIRGDSKAVPGPPMPIGLTAIRGQGDQALFSGDGTPGLPPMTTADSLVLLPVQASRSRIVVIYYVMTRDIRVPMDEQNFKISIQAPNIKRFAATAYDPVADQSLDRITPIIAQNGVELEVSATDMPRLLILDLES